MSRTMLRNGMVLIVVLTALPLTGWGQSRCPTCTGGSCRLTPADDDDPLTREATYRWVRPTDPDDQHRVYLYRGNVQVGGWDCAECYYRSYDARADVWGLPQSDPPVALPPALTRQTVAADEWKVTGVDASRLKGDREHAYTVNGRRVTEETAFDKVQMVDDSAKLWFIPIGTDAVRQKVLTDLQGDPKLDDFRKHVRVWNVPSDHFSLYDRDTNQPMFNTTGNPSIYLMAADGEVLFAQSGYKTGDLEDIRKSDPSYPPDKPPVPQPDAKKNDPPGSPGGAVPLWAILAGGSVATLLFFSKGRKT